MMIVISVDGEGREFRVKVDSDGFIHLTNESITLTFGGIDDIYKLLHYAEEIWEKRESTQKSPTC